MVKVTITAMDPAQTPTLIQTLAKDVDTEDVAVGDVAARDIREVRAITTEAKYSMFLE